jgi:hypothetical protein
MREQENINPQETPQHSRFATVYYTYLRTLVDSYTNFAQDKEIFLNRHKLEGTSGYLRDGTYDLEFELDGEDAEALGIEPIVGLWVASAVTKRDQQGFYNTTDELNMHITTLSTPDNPRVYLDPARNMLWIIKEFWVQDFHTEYFPQIRPTDTLLDPYINIDEEDLYVFPVVPGENITEELMEEMPKRPIPTHKINKIDDSPYSHEWITTLLFAIARSTDTEDDLRKIISDVYKLDSQKKEDK